MATKVQKGSKWAYTIKRKSLLPKPIYLTFDDEAEGDAYVTHLEKLLDHGVVPEEFKQDRKAARLIRHAIDSYLERVHVPESDAAVLGVVRDRVGDVQLDKANYQWAESWVVQMKTAGASPSTIRHHVGALARCFDWMVRLENSIMVSNPLRLLPKRYATSSETKDVERDRRLSAVEENEIRDILKGAKPEGRQRPLELRHGEDLLMLFDLALETAMRMREMYTLSSDQVSIAECTIFLDKTKNGDKRQVPMSSVALAIMEKKLESCNGLLFPWWDGRKESLHSVSALLSQQFSRVFDAAGCADLRFHDLRHEATSRFFERTKLSDLEIALITGHKDPRMLRRYANLRGSNLAAKLW